MDHYGISAIHWNAHIGEIDEVMLHKFVRQPRKGTIAVAHGKAVWSADVANLIRRGDSVWVLAADGRGSYMNTDHVGIKTAQRERLYSCTKDGTATSALIELPRYRAPDDPPR
jgi:hypothetical protein